jgi:two-component system, OmpR family, catabolic regulation response regulator CreB
MTTCRNPSARARSPLESGPSCVAPGDLSLPSPCRHLCSRSTKTGSRIAYAGTWLTLTRYEYLLLAALLERPGRVLSRARLMEMVWSDAEESLDRTVDAHVKTLRAKLRAVREGDPIETHRGLGYSIRSDSP